MTQPTAKSAALEDRYQSTMLQTPSEISAAPTQRPINPAILQMPSGELGIHTSSRNLRTVSAESSLTSIASRFPLLSAKNSRASAFHEA